MPICVLPPLLVNQIAAGEVIERPASVVKELMENSIDAGATRIDIVIEQGGTELIRLSDNGIGIPADELPLAVAPHATSKIERAADLEAIATMGFRGEALASIASVSRMSITSRPTSSTSAAVIEIEGDTQASPRPAAGSPGTVVAVRNLFYNTPARRKFLRTEQTEATRVRDAVETIALAHPSITFTLTQDGRATLELLGTPSHRDRVVDILGSELSVELLELTAVRDGARLWAMIGTPQIARGTNKHLRIFLNGRAINDRTITHAVREAYRGLIEHTRFPTAALFISMPPSYVDVNVHPTKAEVRFRNGSVVHSLVLHALRERLREADLTPSIDLHDSLVGSRARMILPTATLPQFSSGNSFESSRQTPPASDFVNYFRRLDPVQKGFVYTEVKQAMARESPEVLSRVESHEHSPTVEPALPTLRSAPEIMQVHSTFLVTQDEQGLVIIDQHALHERVMFERLSQRLLQGELESQRLLMPATLHVDRVHIEALEQLKPLLQRLGIEAQVIGPQAIAINAFTSLLFERGVHPEKFLHDLLDRVVEDRLDVGNDEAAMHEVLDMMACKAAVKAGDKLTQEELTDLLKYRETAERASNCPHGRPTTLRLSVAELERQFGRR